MIVHKLIGLAFVVVNDCTKIGLACGVVITVQTLIVFPSSVVNDRPQIN